MSSYVYGEAVSELGWAEILSFDPLIVQTTLDHRQPLGLAAALNERHSEMPALFLLVCRWNIEDDVMAAWLRERVDRHKAKFPQQEFVFLANTMRELSLLCAAGLRARLFNHSLAASEARFFPTGAPKKYNAIYNGRLVDWKNHHLALDIPECAFLAYRMAHLPPSEAERQVQEILARHAQAEGHVFLNEYVDGGPVIMLHEAVNERLNEARVGLCLSFAEGVMQAACEYLLAGLPVVSVPSRGGREHYFDPDYCIIAEPDSKSVARAVEELIRRDIPADYIRQSTLHRINNDREGFLDFVNGLIRSVGGAASYSMPWPFRWKVMRLAKWDEHIREVEAGRHLDDFAEIRQY